MLRVDEDAGYIWDVLPGAVLFGAGLTLLVAPLTATVLDSAADRFAGVASGVNNAVARSAGLLAVAVVPVAAGISGTDYTDPAAFSAGFRTAMLICAGMLVAGGGLAAVLVRRPLVGALDTGDREAPGGAAPPPRARIRIEEYPTCGVGGPPVHPGQLASAPGARG
jgi:hypothetical protein